MASIRVYESGTDAVKGAIFLGSRIRIELANQAGVNKNFFKATLKALKTVHADASYEMRCKFFHNGSSLERKITQVKRFKKKDNSILCVVDTYQGIEPKLILKVREEEEREEDTKLRRMKMAVVYPESIELNGFGYLQQAGNEIATAGLSVDDRADCLIPFKFLSRCS